MTDPVAAIPQPERTTLNEPYWAGLAEGALRFQRCRACHNAWLPARAECPRCLRADWAWTDASGRAKLISWVVYHMSYHPAFADKVPYNVALVELAEGPRLISSVLDAHAMRIEQALQLRIQTVGGLALPKFVAV
jgi:uncharacterized OB-fold protein